MRLTMLCRSRLLQTVTHRLVLAAAVWLLGGITIGQERAPQPVSFETQVQPILKAKCGRCHGEQVQKGGLSVVSGARLLQGAESGAVIVAGKPDESRLLEVIRDGEMPPKGNERLTAAEVELIRRWIAEGAAVAPGERPAPTVTQHQIVPLMLLRCAPCHGGRRREAELDLRTKAGMLKGGKSGPAVISGKPEESLIVQRIRAEEMPPRRQLVSVSVKPMEAAELKKLEAWITAGLPETPLAAADSGDARDPLVSDEDRDFWSFRPPRAVVPDLAPLTSDDRRRVNNPIDVFVLSKLREHGLSLSPEADRVTLIRRLSFDLIGLPPEPELVEEFVSDPSADAYERLVDRLLASPHHGERWARHWLDVAGYADSEGAQNEDRVRPNMWRYRDYVIRAFNSDKPYDRFLHEQIAGDELADYEHAPVITDEIYDNLVATGFLRTAPDRTFANITNFVPDRLEVIADEIQILGSAVLGLTLHCARCHSHKFDPLPQRDYFRLAAALKDALDEHDWLGPEARQLPFVTTAERDAWKQHQERIEQQVAPLKEQLKAATDEAAKKTLQEQIQRLEAQRQPEPKIRALWSRGDPSPTYLLQRGNYLTPGHEVLPGVPAVLTSPAVKFSVAAPWPDARQTGRRLALARWLTSSDNPLTARVLVNRVWRHHFGAGLVTTLGNFGKTGAEPSHPELLDWLAVEFQRQGWSIKSLHRLIVTSGTYRQCSRELRVTSAESDAVSRNSELATRNFSADPDNRLLSRMPLRRLEAEVLRDSLLWLSGQLDATPFGPPDDVDVRADGLVTSKPTARGFRRSIYVLHRRTKLPTILENFDSPQMGPNCIDRGESIVAPQALHLLNNSRVHEWAAHFAARVEREVGTVPDERIRRVHQLAFGDSPDDEEMKVARTTLAELTREWQLVLRDQPDAPAEAARRALRNYCHAIMNSAALAYVD